MEPKELFSPGKNIAIKVPPDEFNATVTFYRDVLGFQVIKETPGETVVFDFGGKHLWIDHAPQFSQAEIWLEVFTSDINAAAEHLKGKGVVRQDSVEGLPAGMKGFWIKSPAGIIHLVSEE